MPIDKITDFEHLRQFLFMLVAQNGVLHSWSRIFHITVSKMCKFLLMNVASMIKK